MALVSKPTLLSGGILAIYAIACLVLLFSVGAFGSIDGVGSLIFLVVGFFWMLLPQALLCLASFCRLFLAFGAVVVGGISLYIYWRALFGPDTDPQSGLVLVFWPIYQLGFAGMFLLVGLGASKAFSKND